MRYFILPGITLIGIFINVYAIRRLGFVDYFIFSAVLNGFVIFLIILASKTIDSNEGNK